MAKTPQQILDNHVRRVEQSVHGWEVGRTQGNPDLIALNVDEGFRAWLLQSLIRWRHGPDSPKSPLQEAVRWMQKGIAEIKPLSETALVAVHTEVAGFLSFLTEVPPLSAVGTSPEADRLLDAVLSTALFGDWDQQSWDCGLQGLRKIKGSHLCVETYETYAKLLHAPTPEHHDLIKRASLLFGQRAKDSFFAGGLETNGGGLYNGLVVDYRLAAIMKKRGCPHESMHRWRW